MSLSRPSSAPPVATSATAGFRTEKPARLGRPVDVAQHPGGKAGILHQVREAGVQQDLG